MANDKQTDLELWKTWKQTQNPSDLNKLLDNLKPLIYRETSKWQSSMPVASLESKGRLLAADALQTYSPDRGANVGTHVASRLRKLSRSVYPYQNIARLPENVQLKYNTFNIAQANLNEELGREPTVEELADHLMWNTKTVANFQKNFGRSEFVESAGLAQDSSSAESLLVDFFYRDLPPADKLLFESITGYGGKPVLSNTKLIQKYGITQGQLSYKKQLFTEALKKLQRR